MKKNNPQTLIIKKYENRRLYNTLTSQYINQEQVAQLVREGHDVRVVDAASGEDLTRLILAQIVLEDAKTPDSVFPLDVLRQMIVASGRATQENTLRYMKAMMDMYQNALRALPTPMNPFELMQGRWGQPGGRDGTLRSRLTGQAGVRGSRTVGRRRPKPGRKPPTWTNSRGASESWNPCFQNVHRRKRKALEKRNLAASLDALRQKDYSKLFCGAQPLALT